MCWPSGENATDRTPPRSAFCLPPSPSLKCHRVFTSNRKSLVFCAWRITSVMVSRKTQTIRHHVIDLTGLQEQAKCCYAMPAPNGNIRAMRAFWSRRRYQRERKGNVHRCMSIRSSNFGADKSVTVPAMASRIRVIRDMINDSGDL
jgi:hypothetical protein